MLFPQRAADGSLLLAELHSHLVARARWFHAGQASEAAYGAQLLAFADELHAHPAGRLGTSYAMDYPTKQSSTKRVGAPKAALMTARPFEAHSVYNDIYVKKVRPCQRLLLVITARQRKSLVLDDACMLHQAGH